MLRNKHDFIIIIIIIIIIITIFLIIQVLYCLTL